MFVIDDEPAVVKAISRLLRSAGFKVETFDSASRFLADHDPRVSGCMVLDVTMPEITGLDLQQKLLTHGRALPIVFLTGRGDIPMSVRAMKNGAADFLTKPVNDQILIDAVQRALEREKAERQERIDREHIRARLATLTPREREVLQLIADGMLNKQVASELGTVEKTIKVHRARIMMKMEVESFAELVRMVERAEGDPGSPLQDWQPG